MKNLLIAIMVVIVGLYVFGCSFSSKENAETQKYSKKVASSDTIYVKGEIINYARAYCGILCIGGMIQVRLDSSYYEKDSSNTVFVLTGCKDNENKKGTRVNVIATRLLSTDTACYYKSFSKVDTFSHSYYKLSEEE